MSRGRRRGLRAVIVVGGGAAGVGVAVALKDAGIADVLIVERRAVGASFRRWPRETRFLTPSFPALSAGLLDLNAVALGTSPGHTLRAEHPTGRAYAGYLRRVAQHFGLVMETGVEVQGVTRDRRGFELATNRGELRAECVVWATGEFSFPRLNPFPGAEDCLHSSRVASWAGLAGEERFVVGGYESGFDAAIHLARRGATVTVLDRGAPWRRRDSDPSVALSPFTRERLAEPGVGDRLRMVRGAAVREIRRQPGRYLLACEDGREFSCRSTPILATGFDPGLGPIAEHWERRDDGYPRLTERDESTVAPGMFLVGPTVRHDRHVFCFIYKFRQRFAVVAATIAERLGGRPDGLEHYRAWGMYLDDLSCCGTECVC